MFCDKESKLVCIMYFCLSFALVSSREMQPSSAVRNDIRAKTLSLAEAILRNRFSTQTISVGWSC